MTYATGKKPVEGRTRMQKMLFLLQQEYKQCDFQYKYHAYDYGPYSSTLQSDLDYLIEEGLLSEEGEEFQNGKYKYRYLITKKGARLVESALSDPRNKKLQLKQIYRSAEKIKELANMTTLDNLLRYVYSKYPEYAKFSIFEF